MNISHDQIINSFPKLFNNLKYLAIPNGWYSLLFDLCQKLEKFSGLRFTQVKEKLNGLRVYYVYERKYFFRGLNAREKRRVKRQSKTIDYLIYEAEKVAFRICFGCGNEGERFRIGIFCKNCIEKLKQEYPKVKI